MSPAKTHEIFRNLFEVIQNLETSSKMAGGCECRLALRVCLSVGEAVDLKDKLAFHMHSHPYFIESEVVKSHHHQSININLLKQNNIYSINERIK